jgi:hypothetical protein
MMRWLAVVLATVVASVAAPGAAGADAAQVFGRVPCERTQGVLFCQSQAPVAGSCSTAPTVEDVPCATETYDRLVPDTRVPSWDGTPLDVNVTLPEGNHKNLPLIILIHGYLSVKTGLTDSADSDTLRGSLEWAQRGYVVLSYSSRGQGNSCGWAGSREGTPACAKGWQHLADFRYEIRDTQYLAGLLVDAGIVNPRKIGVTGFSWGGGTSLDLATLRNRTMLPDGRLVPWVSPVRHLTMTIAAAAPFAAWSDIPYSGAPTGRILDYTLTPNNIDLAAAPVPKTSFFDGLVAALEAASYFPPPGVDPG